MSQLFEVLRGQDFHIEMESHCSPEHEHFYPKTLVAEQQDMLPSLWVWSGRVSHSSKETALYWGLFTSSEKSCKKTASNCAKRSLYSGAFLKSSSAEQDLNFSRRQVEWNEGNINYYSNHIFIVDLLYLNLNSWNTVPKSVWNHKL